MTGNKSIILQIELFAEHYLLYVITGKCFDMLTYHICSQSPKIPDFIQVLKPIGAWMREQDK